MNQMNQLQEQMQQQLAAQTFEAEAGGGLVKVSCNGARTITNVSIDAAQFDADDLEGLEDLLVVATNRALEKAAAYEAEQGQAMMNSMIPGGLGGLFGG